MEDATIQSLAIQLARLDAKMDNVIVLAVTVQDHEKRLIWAEAEITDLKDDKEAIITMDTRIDGLEKTQWKIMGLASVIGAALGASGTWLINLLSGTHH